MIAIAGINFDCQDYDERGDVLFCTSESPPSPPPMR
jgi:hypothetical protein